MNYVLPLGLSLIFLVLALIHVYWAFGGLEGSLSAVPSIDGKPTFRPTPLATMLVAAVLALIALLIASVSGFVALPMPHSLLTWGTYAVAAGLLMRAIGDFRLVGFFKRVKGSRFAELDTKYFSPLCLALSAGMLAVAYTH
jgi:uncharacterized membrane protein YtjA (UPF0391 family)